VEADQAPHRRTSQALILMPTLDHRALATVVWALASLHRPYTRVFDAVATRAVNLLRAEPTTVSPQSISMMLWAFASSQHAAPRLFAEAEAFAARRLSEFESRSSVMLLWAFAAARHPAQGVFSAALELMPRIARRLSSPHVRTRPSPARVALGGPEHVTVAGCQYTSLCGSELYSIRNAFKGTQCWTNSGADTTRPLLHAAAPHV
jgi:hypothetical protein